MLIGYILFVLVASLFISTSLFLLFCTIISTILRDQKSFEHKGSVLSLGGPIRIKRTSWFTLIMCMFHYPMSSSSFTPYHSLSFPDTGSATSEAFISGYVNTPAIVQDEDPNLHAHDALGTNQLSTSPLWMLPTPEEYSIVYDVINAIRHCYIPGGLSNAQLISQMVSSTITSIMHDAFSREYYYCLTINQLYPHSTSLYHPPSPASAVEIATPTPPLSASSPSPSPRPQETVHSPVTASEVSSNENIRRLTCDYCHRSFSRRDSLQRHLANACTYTREQPSSIHVFAIGQ